MIFFDKMGHMVSDTSLDELHAFAINQLGFKREWFQDKGDYSHYDLTTPRSKIRAIHKGAKLVHSREIIAALVKLKGGPLEATEINYRAGKKEAQP